jgi:hypothetical protein
MSSLFHSTLHTVILNISNSRLARLTDFFGLRRKKLSHSFHAFSDTCGSPALFPLQRHPVVWNCWYQRLMLLGDGGSLLNCRRNARWTETTDSCFTNCSTQNAFGSRVTIITLLRLRQREKRGVELRMCTQLERLLFRSMWETYFCVRFESRNGRVKLLQSFWYTLPLPILSSGRHHHTSYHGPYGCVLCWCYQNTILISVLSASIAPITIARSHDINNGYLDCSH